MPYEGDVFRLDSGPLRLLKLASSASRSFPNLSHGGVGPAVEHARPENQRADERPRVLVPMENWQYLDFF